MTKTYEELYTDIKNPKLEKALQSIYKVALNSKSFTFKEEVQDRLSALQIIINSDSGDSYTNFKMIQVGLQLAEYLELETLEEVFQMAIGVGTHEVGHIRFTSKRTFDAFCIEARGLYKKAGNTAKNILNILEDRREEYLISMVDASYQNAITFLGERLARKKLKEFEEMEIDATTPLPLQQKFNIFVNALIYMSFTFKVPETVKENAPEVAERLEEAVPYMIYSYGGTSTKDAVLATKAVLSVIQDWIDELNGDDSEGAIESIEQEGLSSNSNGTHAPCEDEDIEDYKEISSELSTSEIKKETEADEKIREKLKEMIEKALKNENDDDEEDETSGNGEADESGENGEAGSDESGDGEGSESSETGSDESGDGEGSESSETGSDESGDGEGSESSETDSDESVDGEGSESSEDGFSEGETQKVKIKDELINVEDFLNSTIEERSKNIKKTLINIEAAPLTEELLKEHVNNKNVPKKARLKEMKKIAVIAKEAVSEKDMHQGQIIEFENCVDKFESSVYKTLVNGSSKIIKSAIQEIEKIKITKSKKNVRNRKKGRLNSRDIHKVLTKNDNLYKSKVDVIEGIKGLEVGVLVDISGSNSHRVFDSKGVGMARYQMNQAVAITLHEVLKGSGIPHFVWSFDEFYGSDGADANMFFNMVDFENCFNKEQGTYLKNITARGGNRDGLAIKTAGGYLADYNKKANNKKLLIVISDGVPAASNYSGRPAMLDVGKQVKALNDGKNPIKTIGIFSGDASENEYFGNMYENAIFANGDSIFELPRKLADTIVAEFK